MTILPSGPFSVDLSPGLAFSHSESMFSVSGRSLRGLGDLDRGVD